MRTHYTALVYMNSLDVHLSYLRHLNEAMCVHVEGRREMVRRTLTTYKNIIHQHPTLLLMTLGGTMWMCDENTPALQSGWGSPSAVKVGQQIHPLVGDTPPRCASYFQWPSPDRFCHHCLCQTCAGQILE